MESIVYFYPQTMIAKKDKNGTPMQSAAKKHWWQIATLREQVMEIPDIDESGFGTLTACGVPSFYYKEKEWNMTYLSEEMKRVVAGARGMTDTMIHPEVEKMLDKNMRTYFYPRHDTVRRFTERLIEKYVAEPLQKSGRIVVLLETILEMDRQMQMTWELLLPYLKWVNELTFYYEGSDEAGEIYGEYLEAYYYEYGLVATMRQYHSTIVGAKVKKQRGSCVVLDFSKQIRIPLYPVNEKMIYIDVVSGMDKESLIARKREDIRYYSPRKYLDTIIKNSYDKLVK